MTATKSKTNFPLILLCVAAIAIPLALVLKKYISPTPFKGLEVGEVAPAVEGEGWLNGPAPSQSDLKGKVLVINAWGSY